MKKILSLTLMLSCFTSQSMMRNAFTKFGPVLRSTRPINTCFKRFTTNGTNTSEHNKLLKQITKIEKQTNQIYVNSHVRHIEIKKHLRHLENKIKYLGEETKYQSENSYANQFAKWYIYGAGGTILLFGGTFLWANLTV